MSVTQLSGRRQANPTSAAGVVPPVRARLTLPGAGRRAWFRRLRADLLTVIGWSSIAAAVAVFLVGREQYGFGSFETVLTSLGAIAGLISMDLMVLMLLLAARIPFVDKAIGHDRALEAHKNLGFWTFTTLIIHMVFLYAAWAISARGFLAGFTDMWSTQDLMLAIVSVGIIGLVGFSSMAAARKRLPREVWFGIHLTTYVSLGLAIPHQFTTGALLSDGVAKVYWICLLSVAVAALVAFRVVRPLVNSLDHSVRVLGVQQLSPDTVRIVMGGRHLDRLNAQAGQFLMWRFWAPGLWWHPHPFSLSAAPDGHTLQITVRALGRGSQALTRVRPGTRVSFEGPFGLFTPATRTKVPVVLAGAGVGIAPIKALLEAMPIEPGKAVVIARASTPDDLLHGRELEAVCRAKGAQLFVLTGKRGRGWAPAQYGDLGLTDLAPWIAEADLYLCGATAWTDALIADATAHGLNPEHIHHERFTW